MDRWMALVGRSDNGWCRAKLTNMLIIIVGCILPRWNINRFRVNFRFCFFLRSTTSQKMLSNSISSRQFCPLCSFFFSFFCCQFTLSHSGAHTSTLISSLGGGERFITHTHARTHAHFRIQKSSMKKNEVFSLKWFPIHFRLHLIYWQTPMNNLPPMDSE